MNERYTKVKLSMTQSKKIAMICHSLAVSPMLVGGLIYALRDSYLSYHADATTYAWHDLAPGIRVLFQAMLNGAGGLMLLLALILITLLAIPFKNNERWSLFAIPLIGISALLITVRAAIFVELNTPAAPPWPWLMLNVGLFISGWFFSLRNK